MCVLTPQVKPFMQVYYMSFKWACTYNTQHEFDRLNIEHINLIEAEGLNVFDDAHT
jgi:hypothetical protein